MRLTIVVDDQCVYVDGKSWDGINLSSADANIHALQWDGQAGWIEYKDETANEAIAHLPAWAEDALAQWQEIDQSSSLPQQDPIADQMAVVYASYPIANMHAVNKILSTQFRNLVLAPRVRQSDGNVIGVQVQTVAGEQTGTGAIGLLSIIDATDLAASMGVPLISDAGLPEDKRQAFKDYLVGYGHQALEANGMLYLWYPWSIDMAKARKNYIITREREDALAAGFSYNGHVWDTSTETRANIAGKAAAIATGLDTSTSVVWRTQDNVNITFTAEEFKQFAMAMINSVEQAYAQSWTRKAAVDAATTYEAIEAA